MSIKSSIKPLFDGFGGDGTAAIDSVEEKMAKTNAMLQQLNHSTISVLEKIVREDPTIDLWPHLQASFRKYGVERATHIELPRTWEKPSPEPEINAKQQKLSFLLRSKQEVPVSRSILSHLLKSGEVLSQESQRTIVRITPNIVVKTFRGDDVTELMNLEHIRATSRTIPVPEPLGMLSIGKESYIFTSFVFGISLDRIWANLHSTRKESIRQQLNIIFKELRRLPLPSKNGYLGGGDPLCCLENRRWLRKSSSPIVNEAQFNEFLLGEGHARKSRIDFIRACLSENNQIVMTHGDLHPWHIMVDEQGSKITGVVDLEVGGGYPEYWEYVKALHTAFREEGDDWHLFLPQEAIGMYFDDYVKNDLICRMVS